MQMLKWWMRIVGAFYVLQFFVMAFVRAPIKALAPEGTLELAAAGDRLARFLVDTWIAFGIEVGVIGVGLLASSRIPQQAIPLVWTVIGIELLKGPVYDVYMLWRGYDTIVFAVWIVIHSVIIATGLLALQKDRNWRQSNAGNW